MVGAHLDCLSQGGEYESPLGSIHVPNRGLHPRQIGALNGRNGRERRFGLHMQRRVLQRWRQPTGRPTTRHRRVHPRDP